VDVQGLQLGQDGGGPGEAVASGRRGVGLEPAGDGEDGPLHLGRDALGDVMGGVRQVVEALDARLEVAAPSLVEPERGAAEGLADVPDRAALEAESDGTFACRELVVHGYLRGRPLAVAHGSNSYRAGEAKVGSAEGGRLTARERSDQLSVGCERK
jgi:hypothetical protein